MPVSQSGPSANFTVYGDYVDNGTLNIHTGSVTGMSVNQAIVDKLIPPLQTLSRSQNTYILLCAQSARDLRDKKSI